MPYEMGAILNKCDLGDLEVLAKILAGYFNLSADKALRKELRSFAKTPSEETKAPLAQHFEKCIRYLGSADLAYGWRSIFTKAEPAGASFDQILNDVSKRLKVKQKPLATLEARLERLVKSVADRTFFSLPVDRQRELFEKAGLSKEQQLKVLNQIGSNKTLFLPLVMSVAGPKVLMSVLNSLVLSLMTRFMTKEAAIALLRTLGTRFPIWVEWLGPIVWVLSLGWFAIDMQGPAYRKTVPALLYIGLVCLRDGPIDGPSFWTEEPE